MDRLYGYESTRTSHLFVCFGFVCHQAATEPLYQERISYDLMHLQYVAGPLPVEPCSEHIPHEVASCFQERLSCFDVAFGPQVCPPGSLGQPAPQRDRDAQTLAAARHKGD